MTRVLILGGTVFVGPSVVRQLVAAGHDVAVFHRGEHELDLPAEIRHIHGDRARLADYRAAVGEFGPDVAVDMRAMTETDARTAVAALRGLAARLVAVSSMDVYRAYGRLHGTEPGPVEPIPFAEDAPLRERLFPYREHTPSFISQRPPWMDEYDKILVERVVLAEDDIAGTVVRFPMVHGERDAQHRFYAWWKRMVDGRPAILMSEDFAAFRSSRTHVDNAAAAVVLAATDERAAHRVYNVGEPDALPMLDWARLIALQLRWPGELIVAPASAVPTHLADPRPGAYTHHLVVDTSRIRRELGYHEVVGRDEGLARALAWYGEAPPSDPAAAGGLDYAAEDAALVTIRGSAVH